MCSNNRKASIYIDPRRTRWWQSQWIKMYSISCIICRENSKSWFYITRSMVFDSDRQETMNFPLGIQASWCTQKWSRNPTKAHLGQKGCPHHLSQESTTDFRSWWGLVGQGRRKHGWWRTCGGLVGKGSWLRCKTRKLVISSLQHPENFEHFNLHLSTTYSESGSSGMFSFISRVPRFWSLTTAPCVHNADHNLMPSESEDLRPPPSPNQLLLWPPSGPFLLILDLSPPINIASALISVNYKP